jgi:hypothetical protein
MNCVASSESVLLPKLCCLQRIYVRSRNCVVSSRSVIRCRNRVTCSELVFATKSVLAAAKWHLLPKLWCLKRNNFRCRIVWPTTNQFSLPMCAASSELVSLPNYMAYSESVFAAELCGLHLLPIFYNRPPGQK